MVLKTATEIIESVDLIAKLTEIDRVLRKTGASRDPNDGLALWFDFQTPCQATCIWLQDEGPNCWLIDLVQPGLKWLPDGHSMGYAHIVNGVIVTK